MPDDKPETTAAAPAAPELSLEERERLGEEQAAKQREGKSGFEVEAPAGDAPLDPRAEKRKELLRQLAALDDTGPDLGNMSDVESHVHFFDQLIEHLGSHPKLEAAWQNLRRRMLNSTRS